MNRFYVIAIVVCSYVVSPLNAMQPTGDLFAKTNGRKYQNFVDNQSYTMPDAMTIKKHLNDNGLDFFVEHMEPRCYIERWLANKSFSLTWLACELERWIGIYTVDLAYDTQQNQNTKGALLLLVWSTIAQAFRSVLDVQREGAGEAFFYYMQDVYQVHQNIAKM